MEILQLTYNMALNGAILSQYSAILPQITITEVSVVTAYTTSTIISDKGFIITGIPSLHLCNYKLPPPSSSVALSRNFEDLPSLLQQTDFPKGS